MRQLQPFIGVDTKLTFTGDGSVPSYQEILGVHPSYLQYPLEAGAIPLEIPSNLSTAAIRKLAGLCQGFILSGGVDIGKGRSNIAPDDSVEIENILGNPTDESRDDANFEVLDHALQTGKPVLGICRGHQIVNLGLGGAVGYLDEAVREGRTEKHFDLEAEDPYEVFHELIIDPQFSNIRVIAELIEAYRGNIIPKMSTAHHMHVVREGVGLVRAVTSLSGTSEISVSQDSRLVGVQGHVEKHRKEPVSQILINNLVRSAIES